MNQKTLSRWLKGLILVVGGAALLLYAVILPYLTAHYTPFSENATAKWLWLSMIWLTALPFYPALALCWQIAARIGDGKSFSCENALALKHISTLSLIDTLLLFTGSLLLFLLGMNRLTMLVFALLFCFLGFLLSVAAAALSHLVYKAAALQEENDLTV